MRFPTSARVEWSDGPLVLRVSFVADIRDFRRAGAFDAPVIFRVMAATAIAGAKSTQARSTHILRRTELSSLIVSKAIVAAG